MLILAIFYEQSYGWAIELDGLRVFTLIESANVHLLLVSFRKVILCKIFKYCLLWTSNNYFAWDMSSISFFFCLVWNWCRLLSSFDLLLQLMPEDLSANFGLASGLLGWARECTSLGAFRYAATLLKVCLWITWSKIN
jgi:superkiller protein 3